MYKYELHMHTSDGSLCGKSTGAEMAEYYIAHGYSGAVVSNHFYHGNTSPSRDLPWQDYVSEYARGYYSFRETVGNRDFDCFFGVEERLDGWDEYIFLGLEPEWYAAHPELRDMKGAEYLDTVRAHGGFVIHAHPFRNRAYMKNLEILLSPNRVDAIEVRNCGNPPETDRLGYEYALKHDLPMTGGSDNHVASAEEKPLSGILLPHRCRTVQQLIDAIRSKKQQIIDLECVLAAEITEPTAPIRIF